MKAFLTVGLGAMFLAGCYTYRPLGPVDAALPAPGSQVEVRLTTAGATTLASQVGPDILLLQGSIVAVDSAALTLAVRHSETARRISSDWKGEHVVVPRQDIASIQGRKFSVGGTVLLGGLAGGGLVAAAALIGGGGTASGTAGGPPSQGSQ